MNFQRRRARELAMKVLYSYRFIKEDSIEDYAKKFFEVSENNQEIDIPYFLFLIDGVLKNQNMIDVLIEKYSKDWDFSRIPPVELELMRIAIFELFFSTVPISVAIDEAVDLSSLYGTENAPKYVNGILGNIAEKELKR